jgi:hypothetical protein
LSTSGLVERTEEDRLLLLESFFLFLFFSTLDLLLLGEEEASFSGEEAFSSFLSSLTDGAGDLFVGLRWPAGDLSADPAGDWGFLLSIFLWGLLVVEEWILYSFCLR